MIKHEKIRVGKKTVEAVVFKLATNNLIAIAGRKGYIMCGYLNLRVAQKFKEAAVKIIGVSSLQDVLKTKVYAATSKAKKLGIYKGQPIKDVLKIIA